MLFLFALSNYTKGVGKMNVLDSSRLFLKRNASTILTCVGSVGVVATSILSVKGASKAKARLEKAKEEKGEELTKKEVFIAAAPAYIPAVLSGAGTIACMFGANTLNKRQQASLVSAYAVLDTSFKEYKKKVEELYGEDADETVRSEIAKDKYENFDIVPTGEKVLFYDEYTQKYFEATMEEVIKAEYLLNRDLSFHGYAVLNDFYTLLDLPNVEFGDILGWNIGMIYDMQWYGWVEFNHRRVVLDDGLHCYILEILTEPIPNFDEEYY